MVAVMVSGGSVNEVVLYKYNKALERVCIVSVVWSDFVFLWVWSI